ncbi:restriction endonuclease [Patescibacteria group bacterium]|nr:restriction endonuclease [Patescibacteria group bacterium]
MANSNFLRSNINQHIVKNSDSKKMDRDIVLALRSVVTHLQAEYPDLIFTHTSSMPVNEIVASLSKQYPEYSNFFNFHLPNSNIRPDGGFLFATNKYNERRLILVAEVKKQGTNDLREQEGKKKQAKGNAIERLGKNLIGIRTIFKNEGILPFVCFGSGDDFKNGSSILDRVITMNEFFPLNQIFVKKSFPPFEPVSMFFRYEKWEVDQMSAIMSEIAAQAIEHKFV